MMLAVLALVLTAAQPSMGERLGYPGLDLEGWDLAGRASVGTLTLTHAALGDQIPNFPQVWIRGEPLGAAPAASTLQLVEFDCQARRMRLRESYRYARRNLTGVRADLFLGKGAWDALTPAPWMEPTFAAACAQ
jgi:hypothetical protein